MPVSSVCPHFFCAELLNNLDQLVVFYGFAVGTLGFSNAELRDFIDTLTLRAPVIESVNSHVVLHLAKRTGAPPLD